VQINEEASSANLEVDFKRAVDLSNQIVWMISENIESYRLETYRHHGSMEDPGM
jgi:hypothetical protein